MIRAVLTGLVKLENIFFKSPRFLFNSIEMYNKKKNIKNHVRLLSQKL